MSVDTYHNYSCKRHFIFPDFPVKKLGMCIVHKNYIINYINDICSDHIPHHIKDGMTETKVISTVETNVF